MNNNNNGTHYPPPIMKPSMGIMQSMDNLNEELASCLHAWGVWPTEEQKWWYNFSSKTDCVREQLENGVRMPDGSIGSTCDLEKIWEQRRNTIDQMIGNGPVFPVAEKIRQMILAAVEEPLLLVLEDIQYHRDAPDGAEDKAFKAVNVILMQKILEYGNPHIFGGES